MKKLCVVGRRGKISVRKNRMDEEVGTAEVKEDKADNDSFPAWAIVLGFVLCGCIMAFMIWYVLYQALRHKTPRGHKGGGAKGV